MRYEYDSQGDPSSATGIVIDVTGRVEAQAQIMHLAHHDALTGLPNRTLFRIRLDHALEDAAAGPGFALLCIDLDGFKPVNDRLGHPAGDALLRAVADRLNGMVREEDTLARLGGDEFSIIQRSGHQPQTASGLARRVIAALAAPFDIEGHAVSIGGSIGIARAPADSVDRDHLFKAADTALYRAKKTGRGRHCFFAEREDDAAQPAARAGAARVLPHRDLAML
jgi:diguanylate cyclase (GGDEF)-like protein